MITVETIGRVRRAFHIKGRKIKEIARVPRDGMDKPVTPVVLEAVEISAR